LTNHSIYCRYQEKFQPFEEYFLAQTKLVWELIALLDKNGRPKRLKMLEAMLYPLLTHSGSITSLVRDGYVPEAYLVSRSFFEKCVNFCYLNVCDGNEYENQLSWTRQKMLRALYSRQRAYKNIEHDIPLPEIAELQKINDDLKRFTGKKGGEKPNWTSVSIYDRIQFIKKSVDSFPIEIYLLTMNRFYEDASEVIHGTLYGCLFHTGKFWGVKESVEENVQRLVSWSLEILYFLGSLIDGILVVVSTIMSVDELLTKSKDNFSKVSLTKSKWSN
jgi:hypothetical protein